MRRIRTRLPTYLSTGFGALVDIANSHCDLVGKEEDDAVYASGAYTVKTCLEAG